MKTPIDSVNSSIIVPNRSANASEGTVRDNAASDRAPRAHIVTRRAERWARRSTH